MPATSVRTVLALGLVLTAALQVQPAAAFPYFYVDRGYAQSCTDHPRIDFGKVHEFQKAPDNALTFAVVAASSGKVISGGKVCGGETYTVLVDFGEPSKRNYLLTSTHGSLVAADKNDCDDLQCPNRVCSPAPTAVAKAALKLPCDAGAAGKQVVVKVTSANGRIPAPGSSLRTGTLSLELEGNCPGKCGAPAAVPAAAAAAAVPAAASRAAAASGSTGTSSSGTSSSAGRPDRTVTESGGSTAPAGGARKESLAVHQKQRP